MRLRKKRFVVLCLLAVLTSFTAAAAGKELVNMEFKEAPLVDVLQILGQIGGYNVLADQSVSGQVSFVLKDLTVTEALDLVTRAAGYRYKLEGNTLIVGSAERLEREFEKEDIAFIMLKHVDVLEAEKIVKMVAPRIRTSYCTERQLLILFGYTSDLNRAKEVLKEFDQPNTVTIGGIEPEVKGEPLIQKRIPVFYAGGQDILDAVITLWPQRDFKWDGDSKILTGFAQKEEWPAIEDLVKSLDLPKFILKGILKSEETTIALIEYEGLTELLQQGDLFLGWLLSSITAKDATFTRGDQSVTVRLGR